MLVCRRRHGCVVSNLRGCDPHHQLHFLVIPVTVVDAPYIANPSADELVALSWQMAHNTEPVWDYGAPRIKTVYHPRVGMVFFDGIAHSHEEILSEIIERYGLPDEVDWEGAIGQVPEEHDPVGELGPSPGIVGAWTPGDPEVEIFWQEEFLPASMKTLSFGPENQAELEEVRKLLHFRASKSSKFMYEAARQFLNLFMGA